MIRRQYGSQLFDRAYELTLAPQLKSSTALQYGNTTRGGSPLRITFDLKKDSDGKPNTGHIVIYNMSEANRRVVAPGWAVQLRAGYQGSMQTLWLGQVGRGIASRNPDLTVAQKASSKREGPDISFSIESADGLGPLTRAKINASYPDGTPLSVVFDDIKKIITQNTPATGFGVSIGSIPKPLPLAVVHRGLQLHCTCSEALNKLFNPIGYDWHVPNNALCVVARNDHSKDVVPFLSQETGLINIPSREDGGVVSLSCLLNPAIVPGGLVELRSVDTSFNGYYKVRKVQHKGDTSGEDWSSQLECIAYGSSANLPISTPPVS